MTEAGQTTEQNGNQAAEEELESQGLVDISPLRLEPRGGEGARDDRGLGLPQGIPN